MSTSSRFEAYSPNSTTALWRHQSTSSRESKVTDGALRIFFRAARSGEDRPVQEIERRFLLFRAWTCARSGSSA